MNVDKINEIIREFGLIANERSLFGLGKEIHVDFISETVLSGTIEKNGGVSSAVMIGALLNKSFLSVNELRGAVVDALKKAARRSARDLTQDIIELAM